MKNKQSNPVHVQSKNLYKKKPSNFMQGTKLKEFLNVNTINEVNMSKEGDLTSNINASTSRKNESNRLISSENKNSHSKFFSKTSTKNIPN